MGLDRRVAAAFRRPDARYIARLDETCADLREESIEAARHLTLFVGRIRELGLDELQELYAETFDRDARTSNPIVRLPRTIGSASRPGAILDALVAALPRLEAERNPFACAARALCCLLLVDSRAPASLRRFGASRPPIGRRRR